MSAADDARATKEDGPHSAAAEAAAEVETEQEEMDQMRDTDEASTAAASPTAVLVGFKPPPGWDQWNMQRRNMHKQRQREKHRREGGG